MIDPQIIEALDVISDVFGPVKPAYSPGDVPHGYRWADQWRADPIGRCVRCLWPSHTLGPDGQPWHAFCWGTDTAAPAFDPVDAPQGRRRRMGQAVSDHAA